MVDVRPAVRSASSFTLRKEGTASAPRVTDAAVGTTAIGAPATTAAKAGDRDESEFAWRLRHLKRGVLKEAELMAGIPQDKDWFLTDSFEFLGRAVGSSAKPATALFSDLSLGGQVNLLTTGAFDNPLQLLQLDRTSSVAFFSVGAPVGSHGDWAVRAAMNQSDLSSWMLAGSYVVTAPVAINISLACRPPAALRGRQHRGDDGGVRQRAQRRLGVCLRRVDRSRYLSVGYGANTPLRLHGRRRVLLSPRRPDVSPTAKTRIRASVARQLSAPGAEEFLPPSSAEYLPPQRTFSPLTRAGLRAQDMRHYELGVERVMNGATIGVRAFEEQIDNQTVTVFGLRQSDDVAAALGHYYVGAAGNADIRGVGVTFTHALFENVRGSIDYSMAKADWSQATPVEYALLTRRVPSAVRSNDERIHDVTTSLQTEIPLSATRVMVLYKLNNAFVSGTAERPGFDARFDLQINQALPFMNFSTSQWEMLVGVRNLFHESLANASIYDELLVVRPPKRIVGGLTVKF